MQPTTIKNRWVVYDGPSQLNGERIIVVALLGSSNSKTGDMMQTYILAASESPVDAVNSGSDYAICGDCKHRGVRAGTKRSCYVNLGQGPRAVWDAWNRNRYAYCHPADVRHNANVRVGTYGDPVADPVWVWIDLLENSRGNTGYTHQWLTHPELKPYCMASVDSLSELVQAHSMGWRTFRVLSSSETPSPHTEILCPASAEAGHRVQCHQCLLCDGLNTVARSVAIPAHGSLKSNFELVQLAS